MVQSITNIADLAQIALSDTAAATWSQDDVEAWVLEAIRDYGSHFHRILQVTITLTTGTHIYDMPNDYLAPVRVEYPKDEDPPQYLDRLTSKHPDFWASDRFYDVIEFATAGTKSHLVVGAEVTTGEYINLTYQAMYYNADADIPSEACLVPDTHIPLLVLYVQWKAAVERLNAELQNPDRSINLIDDMNDSVDTARRAYERAIDRAKAAGYQSRWTEPWTLDTYDPIY